MKGLKRLIMVCVSVFFIASSIRAENREKVELIFSHAIGQANGSNETLQISRWAGKDYTSNLWGAGVRYYPKERFFFEIIFMSLFQNEYTGIYYYNLSNTDPARIADFKKIRLTANHGYSLKDNLNIFFGFGGVFGRGLMLASNTAHPTSHFWNDSYFSWDLRTGVEYRLTERLKIGVGLNYETEDKIEFIQDKTTTPETISLNNLRISLETALSLSF